MHCLKLRITLRRFNDILTAIVVALALYVLVYPIWPNISFWWNSLTGHKPSLVAANSTDGAKKAPPENVPKENTLVVPALNMQEVIHEGPTESTLLKGVWRRPHTSSPPQGSNTTIAGHRFTYRGAAVFYHLDKVAVGDKIVLYWEGKKYQYEVSRTYIVPPSASEVEEPTKEPILTLYTCTPLWTSKSRLVVEARLVNI